jgi:hypothetical protein
MDRTEAPLLASLQPLQLIHHGSIPKRWNDVILNQIKSQGIQDFVSFVIPIEAYPIDAQVIGAFDTSNGSNKIAEICSELLFTISSALTHEMPAHEPDGIYATYHEKNSREKCIANGTLDPTAFKVGGVLPEPTYQAIEVLFADDNVTIVGYRIVIFITDVMTYDMANRIKHNFTFNMVRKYFIAQKGTKQYYNQEDIDTRPGGKPYRLAYEERFIDINTPRHWGELVSWYTSCGLENSFIKKKSGNVTNNDNNSNVNRIQDIYANDEDIPDGIDPNIYAALRKQIDANEKANEGEDQILMTSINIAKTNQQPNARQNDQGEENQRTFDKYNTFKCATVDVGKISTLFGEEFFQSHHPWNPKNIFNKETSMVLWTKRVRESQRNIGEYFRIPFAHRKSDLSKLGLAELFNLGKKISGADFIGFPHPENVFVYSRFHFVPSLLYIGMAPQLLVKDSEFEKILRIESKKELLYNKKPEDLTEIEKIEKGIYDLMVLQSMPPQTMNQVECITIADVNSLQKSVQNTINSLISTFASTGKIIEGRIRGRDFDPNNKQSEDLEYMLDKEWLKKHDVFLRMREENTAAFKYLDTHFSQNPTVHAALYKMLVSMNLHRAWRAIKYSADVSPVLVKTRNWFFNLPPEKQWPNISSGFSTNLTFFGDMTLRKICYISEIERCVTNTRLARQLLMYRYNAFKYESDKNHQRNNVCMPGPGMGGKSFLLNLVCNTSTPGSIHEATHISEQAYSISGIYDGEIVILHETSKDFFGIETSNGSGSKSLQMLKDRMEREIVNTTRFNNKLNKDDGVARRVKTIASVQGLTFVASNINLTHADTAFLSRFLMKMVAVRKGMPVGYRVKDRQKTEDTEVNNDAIREDERHQQVLIHTYCLFLETMIKANVFNRQVFMGNAVELTNKIIEELQKKHKMDGIDTRHNSQLENINRSTSAEYALYVSHATPFSFKWSRRGNTILPYNPMVIAELTTKFLYITKEMLVHTITIEDEAWTKTLVYETFVKICRRLLSSPISVDFLKIRTSQGEIEYDRNYVCVYNQDSRQIYEELCTSEVGLSAAELEQLIKGFSSHMVQPNNEIVSFLQDFERAYEQEEARLRALATSSNSTFVEQLDDDYDNVSKQRVSESELANIDNNLNNNDIQHGEMDIDSIMDQVKADDDINDGLDAFATSDSVSDSGCDSMEKEALNLINKSKAKGKKNVLDIDDIGNIKKGKKKGKSSANIISHVDNVRVRLGLKPLKFIQRGVIDGQYYIAFHIGELKKIEADHGKTKSNPVIEAVKSVLSTDCYEKYPSQIQDIMSNEYGVTENQLINTPIITGLEGKPIVIPVKDGDIEHEVLIPIGKYSPTITIPRGTQKLTISNYNYITSAAKHMLFQNKTIEPLTIKTQEQEMRLYRYDIDFYNYLRNCEENHDDPYKEDNLIALPIFTKRVLKSIVEYIYDDASNISLEYPRDFIDAEFKKVMSIYLHNTTHQTKGVQQVIRKLNNPENHKAFTFDENGNYVSLNVDEGWGKVLKWINPDDHRTKVDSISKIELLNFLKDQNIRYTVSSKDDLLNKAVNDTDVGDMYTMELIYNDGEEPVNNTQDENDELNYTDIFRGDSLTDNNNNTNAPRFTTPVNSPFMNRYGPDYDGNNKSVNSTILYTNQNLETPRKITFSPSRIRNLFCTDPKKPRVLKSPTKTSSQNPTPAKTPTRVVIQNNTPAKRKATEPIDSEPKTKFAKLYFDDE